MFIVSTIAAVIFVLAIASAAGAVATGGIVLWSLAGILIGAYFACHGSGSSQRR